jgi:hypothetical protein
VRRLAFAAALVALAVPATAWGMVFRPSALPAGKVGVPYKVVIHVSAEGHNPSYGKQDPDFTINCYGANAQGSFVDSCSRMPPGVTVRAYADSTCSPPLSKPACFELAGVPRKAGTYVFQIYVPDVNSFSAKGIATTFKLLVRA